MKKILFIITLVFISTLVVNAQEKSNITAPDPTVSDYVPLTVKLSPDGGKYIRFLMWGQFWLTGANDKNDVFQITPSLRRMRFLAYAQVSPRFLILMHIGVNSLSANNMDATGNMSNAAQLFLHGAWMEYAIIQKYFYVGGGLHYWNGISRLNSQSTLNMMTLDNYRRAWSTLGLADQFARNMGIYAKGKLGKLEYRVSANSPIKNSLDMSNIPTDWKGQTLYTGRYELPTQADWSYQGYFEYQFLDQEANQLPYKVGTYLGAKKVFNLGAGFFSQPKGSITYNADSTLTPHNVSHYAFDVFYDAPVGKGAITAYSAFYLFNYGPDYVYQQIYGTGNSFLVQVGYLLPKFVNKVSFQPYATFNTAHFTAFENAGNTVRFGLNMFLDGHHAKFTLEYNTTQDMYNSVKPDRFNSIILQAQIFL